MNPHVKAVFSGAFLSGWCLGVGVIGLCLPNDHPWAVIFLLVLGSVNLIHTYHVAMRPPNE